MVSQLKEGDIVQMEALWTMHNVFYLSCAAVASCPCIPELHYLKLLRPIAANLIFPRHIRRPRSDDWGKGIRRRSIGTF